MLHVLERVAQLAYLVTMLDDRQGGVKLSLSHLVGSVCQLLQGLCRAPDGEEAYQESDRQHTNDNYQHDDAHHIANKV